MTSCSGYYVYCMYVGVYNACPPPAAPIGPTETLGMWVKYERLGSTASAAERRVRGSGRAAGRRILLDLLSGR